MMSELDIPAGDGAAHGPAGETAPEHHVIIAGYGTAARRLVHVLAGSNIPLVIITLSPSGANEAEAEGHRVIRGDAANPHILDLAGLRRAKMLVIADDIPGRAHHVLSVVRPYAPAVRIVVRVQHEEDAEALREDGADQVITMEMESIVQLFAEVLRDYNVEPSRIESYEAVIRSSGYAALRDWVQAPDIACDLSRDDLETRRIVVRSGTALAGQTIEALDLEGRHEVHLRDVLRDGVQIPHPPRSLSVQPGDELVLAGTSSSLAGLDELLRAENLTPQGRVTED